MNIVRHFMNRIDNVPSTYHHHHHMVHASMAAVACMITVACMVAVIHTTMIHIAMITVVVAGRCGLEQHCMMVMSHGSVICVCKNNNNNALMPLIINGLDKSISKSVTHRDP